MVFLSCSFAYSAEKKLVAATYSDRYHLLTCKIVQKILPDERVYFETADQAHEAGFNPCKKCRPPAPAEHPPSRSNIGTRHTEFSDESMDL